MEIPEKGPLQDIRTQDRTVEELPQLTMDPIGVQRRSGGRDTVNLTERGREFNSAVQHVQVLPDIREDRVMQLKRKVEEGIYRVEGHRIAVNMINETLENNHVLQHIDIKT